MFTPRTTFQLLAFPTPIALSYRRFLAESPHRADRQILHLLSATEALLQLTGSAVLVDAHERVREFPGDTRLKRALDRLGWNKATLGLWGEAIVNVAPLLETPFLGELRQVFDDPSRSKRLRQAIEVLIDERNQLSHPVRPLGHAEAAARMEELLPAFEQLTDALEFLRCYPVVMTGPVHPRRHDFLTPVTVLHGPYPRTDSIHLITTRAFAANDILIVAPDGRQCLSLSPLFISSGDDRTEPARMLHAFAAHESTGKDVSVQYHCFADTQRPVSRVLGAADGGGIRIDEYLRAEGRSAERPPLRSVFAATDDGVEELSVRGWSRVRHQTLSAELPLADIVPFRLGGMAEIYRGVDRELGHPRIMKVLRNDGDPRFAKKHRQEAELLARLEHPSIIRFFGASNVPGVGLCIIEDFFDGPSLEEHLQAGHVFEPAETIRILKQLLEGLAYIHRCGIVHRDLKPANLLFRRADGALKIIDFGIAKDLQGRQHGTTKLGAGTYEFMAPEQLENTPISPQTDLFAVGVITCVLLTGTPAPRVRSVPDLSGVALPPPFGALIAQACRYDARERFESAEEMWRFLESGSPAPSREAETEALVPPGEMTQAAWDIQVSMAVGIYELALRAGVGERLLKIEQIARNARGTLVKWRETFPADRSDELVAECRSLVERTGEAILREGHPLMSEAREGTEILVQALKLPFKPSVPVSLASLVQQPVMPINSVHLGFSMGRAAFSNMAGVMGLVLGRRSFFGVRADPSERRHQRIIDATADVVGAMEREAKRTLQRWTLDCVSGVEDDIRRRMPR